MITLLITALLSDGGLLNQGFTEGARGVAALGVQPPEHPAARKAKPQTPNPQALNPKP